MEQLRNSFLEAVRCIGAENPQVVVVAVKLPTGAIEVITNTQNTCEKLLYYVNAYDNLFRLKSNPAISIVGYMIV